MRSVEEMFRRLSIGDPRLVGAIGDPGLEGHDVRRLDERTETLLRLGALVALDAPQSSYEIAVGAALRAGTEPEDLLAVLVAIAGAVGSVRVVAAAPRIALAAGYDVDAALERHDPAERRARGSATTA
jgi:4-carboxymuconolactone decarboxylase